MKITITAKPISGESRRCQLKEIIVQMHLRAILNLRQTARFARDEEHLKEAAASEFPVMLERLRDLTVRLQTGSQHDAPGISPRNPSPNAVGWMVEFAF